MRILTLSQLSLAGSSGIAEAKIPLWCADGTSASTTITAAASSLLQDGQTGTTSASGSATHLFTLSSNWNNTMQFAIEASVNSSNAISGIAYCAIYDITSSALVSASQVSGTSLNNVTVIRSGKFSLTPSHVYGVSFWTNSGYTAYCSDASLIIFPS